ncbi:MAG: ABC transporter permease [Longimicrobiales bacterium]
MTLRHDLHYAWRTLRKSPGFMFTVLATLAIGIGATTAIFSLVNALLLRPLPFPQSDRMTMVWQDHTKRGGPAQEWFTPPDFRDLRDRNNSFVALAAVGNWGPTLTADGQAEMLSGAVVSASFFDVVGVRPALGAPFTAQHELQGQTNAVVLGYTLWQRRFGSDRTIVGSNIQLNDQPHIVLGVMPEGFRDPLFSATEIWRARLGVPQGCGRGCYTLRVIGRLKPAVTVQAASAEATALSSALARDFPQMLQDVSFRVHSLQENLVAPARVGLIALSLAVGLLLLTACVNIANLLVARAGVRERELAIRSALGASRWIIARQLFIEVALLGVLGAALGGLLALWGVDMLVAMAPPGTPRLDEVRVDAAALAFAFVAAMIAALGAGLGPTLQTARSRLGDVLKGSGALRTSLARRRTRGALIVGEVSIALALLIGAGLLVKSFARLQQVDPGFNLENVATGFIGLPGARYRDPASVQQFVQTLLQETRRIPGVQAAATTSILPMNGGDNDANFLVEGRPPAPDGRDPAAWYRFVSPDYFAVMQMRLVTGRFFTVDDHASSARVVMINETLARRHFAGENPVGKRLLLDGNAAPAEIVGVVGDIRQRGLDQPTVQEYFVPVTQNTNSAINLVIRGTREADFNAPVRTILRRIDPNLAPPTLTSMETIVGRTVALPRLYSAFFAFFAIVALLLAAVGIYGITAFAVTQRRQEIGVRLAVGARADQVVSMVVRQSMTLAITGMAIGLVAAALLSRVLSKLLFEMSARDLATFVSVPILLAMVALAACWLPARRAAGVDPLHALRRE